MDIIYIKFIVNTDKLQLCEISIISKCANKSLSNKMNTKLNHLLDLS
jgi:hypothetical protein